MHCPRCSSNAHVLHDHGFKTQWACNSGMCGYTWWTYR